VSIVLSSDLDELVIWQILSQLEAEAPRYGLDATALIGRITFGVGTRLITSHGDSALGGVYKLVAIDDLEGEWSPTIKLSETIEKVPVPGEKRLMRVYDNRGLATADVIAMANEDPLDGDRIELFHPHREVSRTIERSEISDSESLLARVFAGGRRLDGEPGLEEMRDRRRKDLERLDPGVRRLVNPHIYHVSLTRAMKDLQLKLMARLGH
jgi:nicotinate phosphoribosyltransferase